MADTDPEVKGSSKAGSIAIATALIGAVTTISVAYINKGTPAAEVRQEPAKPASSSGGGPSETGSTPPSQPASNVVAEDEPVIQPQPLMQTPRNVAGIWNAANGEQMEISQNGSQLVVNGGVMADFGPIVWQGYGRITDRKLSWTAQAAANGNQVEIECTGRLTTSGNSIQGTCDVLGQQQTFQYTR